MFNLPRQPEIYKASAIKTWNSDVRLPNGEWRPARPIGSNVFGFKWRWKIAFDVLTGKADGLYWD